MLRFLHLVIETAYLLNKRRGIILLIQAVPQMLFLSFLASITP